jgi:hypothetical protein
MQIFQQADFRIEPGVPYERPLSFAIPHSAMHSFQSSHNAVNWKLVVSGLAEGWPPFQRSFPIIVYPERQAATLTPDFKQDEPAQITLRVPERVGA